jgi:O-antigen/teichoic acid export membrane protein
MSALINIGLNFVLISRFGMMGAAWSTAVSFFAMAALSYFVSQKVYSIPYVFRRAITLLALAAVFYLASIMLPITSLVLAVLVKLALVLLFPVGLFLVGFFHQDEKSKAKELALGLLSRYRLRAAAVSGR